MIYVVGEKKKNFQTCDIDFIIEYFKDKIYVQVDTETEGFFDHKNKILTLQLGDEETQFVIIFKHLTLQDKLKLTEQILNNPDKVKILQNAKFDTKFLWFHGMQICNIYDTMLAEMILHTGKDMPKGSYSLYNITLKYCNKQLKKEVRGRINKGLSDEVIKYAAEDVKYLEKIAQNQIKQLSELDLCDINNIGNELTVLGLENKCLLAFAMIEYHGIHLDKEKWDEIITTLEKEIKEINLNLNSHLKELDLDKYLIQYQDLFTAPEERSIVNWSSPAQKLDVLRNIIPELEDTSERTLSKHKNIPLVKELIHFNKRNKLSTAFAKKMYSHINTVSDRIHTYFFQILNTGRVSSAKPKLSWAFTQ